MCTASMCRLCCSIGTVEAGCSHSELSLISGFESVVPSLLFFPDLSHHPWLLFSPAGEAAMYWCTSACSLTMAAALNVSLHALGVLQGFISLSLARTSLASRWVFLWPAGACMLASASQPDGLRSQDRAEGQLSKPFRWLCRLSPVC